MRAWVEETLLNGPLAEQRNNCILERRRKAVPVDIRNLSVPCAKDGDGGSFGIRVYEPRIGPEEQDSKLRPAMLMVHGGGWIHGKPQCDEGES